MGVKCQSVRRFIALFSLTAGAFFAVILPAHAYIGPGVGVSLLGAIVGLISVIALACWGLIRYVGHSLLSVVAPGRLAAAQRPSLSPESVGQQSTKGQSGKAAGSASRHHGIALRLSYLVLGLVVAVIFPQPREFIFSSLSSTVHVIEGFQDPKVKFFSLPARFPEEPSGVVTHHEARAWRGLNLELSATHPVVRLLDMKGRELHRWSLSRETIAAAWAAEGEPVLDTSGLYWRRVQPLPDGSVLIVLSNMRETPYAAGMMKLDWDSNVVWMNPSHYHHSLDVDEQGRILTLYQEINKPPVSTVPWVEKPFLDEGIAILSPDGVEIDRINILEAFAGTPFKSFLSHVENDPKGDPIHMNTVDVLTAKEAARTALAGEGDILVSMRNMDTVAIVDGDTRKVTWAASGFWKGQHEPVLTGGRNLMVFDNRGPGDGSSRVVEWNTATGKAVWSWAGTPAAKLSSEKYGVVSRLPNGNRLITESYGGRSIEVTADGRVVWEWRSDRSIDNGQRRVGNLIEVVRIPENFFGQRIAEGVGETKTARAAR